MTGISFQGIVKYQREYPWQHPSISIASLHLEEKGKQVENQKVMQSSWAEMRTLCCQWSYVSQIWSVGIYQYRDLHCGLLKTEGYRWKILTGREAEKGGLEKIDGQLSERERKLREREQTLQKSAVHWSQQWRGRPRESCWEKSPVTFTGWNLLMKKHILGYILCLSARVKVHSCRWNNHMGCCWIRECFRKTERERASECITACSK